jgi:predicted transcriptional regulator
MLEGGRMTLKQAFFILRHGSAEGIHKYLEAITVIEDEYNRQKEEIEELREIVFMDRSEAIKQLKAEAVKELAEMLKATAIGRVAWDDDDEAIEGFVAVDEIDNLVKEFSEGGDTK